MTRKITDTAATCKTDIDWVGFADNPTEWLSRQMQAHKLKYLLAHVDDGVIWGRLDDQKLITSNEVAPKHSPPLREEMLQTARIFADAGELLIWRDEVSKWAGRLITEITKSNTTDEQANHPSTEPALPAPTVEWTKAFDEYQILLGTKAETLERDFALMSEGSQGLFHVVPLHLEGKIDEQVRPLRLVVRHYLKADDNGFLRVNASRLVDLLLVNPLREPKESNA